MSTVEHLVEEAKSLSASERLGLASRLLAMEEPEAASEVEQAWENEIEERIHRFDRGETRTRPAKDVIAECSSGKAHMGE